MGRNATAASPDVVFLRNLVMQVEGQPPILPDVAVVIEPNRIRLAPANFDPLRMTDNDLLASLAAADLVSPAAVGAGQDDG